MNSELRKDLADVLRELRDWRETIAAREHLYDWHLARDRLLREGPPRELDTLEEAMPDETKAIFFGLHKHRLMSVGEWEITIKYYIDLYARRCFAKLRQGLAIELDNQGVSAD